VNEAENLLAILAASSELEQRGHIWYAIRNMGNRYFRVSDLRLHLDLFWWEYIFQRSHLLHQRCWASPSRVPTMEVVLYWILEDADFASNVVKCLDLIEREMNMTHEEVKSHRKRSERTRLWDTNMNLISFICAIILIDGMAKKPRSSWRQMIFSSA
jgi:hypothetical protein